MFAKRKIILSWPEGFLFSKHSPKIDKRIEIKPYPANLPFIEKPVDWFALQMA